MFFSFCFAGYATLSVCTSAVSCHSFLLCTNAIGFCRGKTDCANKPVWRICGGLCKCGTCTHLSYSLNANKYDMLITLKCNKKILLSVLCGRRPMSICGRMLVYTIQLWLTCISARHSVSDQATDWEISITFWILKDHSTTKCPKQFEPSALNTLCPTQNGSNERMFHELTLAL